MPIFSIKERNLIILLIILALGCFLFYTSLDIAGSIMGAIVFYSIFRPFHRYLVESRGWKAWLSSLFIIFLSFFIILVPLFFTVSMIIGKVHELSGNTAAIKDVLANIDRFAAEKLHQEHLIQDLFLKAQGAAVQVVSGTLGKLGSVALQTAIMYFLLYFMFADYKSFEQSLIKYSPFSNSDCARLGKELENMTYSNILGQGFIAIIQGGLLAIGFLIFGISDPLFWGVIGVFLSFIPVVGTPLIIIPTAIIAISNGDTVAGVGILLWGFILISNIDNVLRLLISKKIAGTHPIIIIVGVIIGIPVFGIFGLVYGPLLISGFLIFVNIYEKNRELMKKEPGI